jgi:DNA-binding XRE family transcriptional regulator
MKSNTNSPLADNIKKYRNKLGVSQDKLSKIANVTYNTLIKLESGSNKNPTISTISKIAKALEVKIDDLLKT